MLNKYHHWIFDLDGTLTVAQHDFDAIRETLGLPVGQPILEAIDELPDQQAEVITQQLDQLELVIAAEAQPQEGALELLQALAEAGHNIGIVTRNSHQNAQATLAACQMDHLFSDINIISRNCAQPKPHPDGIHKLLNRWLGDAEQAVMIGDFLFDIQSGNYAGVTTVYFDPQQQGLWSSEADMTVTSLIDLRR